MTDFLLALVAIFAFVGFLAIIHRPPIEPVSKQAVNRVRLRQHGERRR